MSNDKVNSNPKLLKPFKQITNDLSYKTFGRWFVLYPAGVYNESIYYFCVCKCGEEKFVRGPGLSNGTSKGCSKSCSYQKWLGNNFSGKTLIKLKIKIIKILKFEKARHTHGKDAIYSAVCTEHLTKREVEHYTISVAYRTGVNTGCGCTLGFKGRSLRLRTGEAGLNAVYTRYKINAKGTNKKDAVPFELSKDQFRKLTASNCHYCGVVPSTKWIPRLGTQEYKRHSTYIYNGIDRKDNKLGYTVKNSLPCCTTCNYMKKDHSYDSFTRLINSISKNLK